MTPYMRRAVLQDAVLLAPVLREDDLRESEATGIEPQDGIERGIRDGAAWTMCDEEGPFGIFGVVDHETLPGVGRCWMVSSERLHKHSARFLRQNRTVFSMLHRQWPVLTNFVDARNTVHIKWLRWMGFVFIALHQHHGVQRMPFYEIARIQCQT